jgi:hypothetical protein
MTLAARPGATYSAQAGVVMFGDPIIHTTVNDTTGGCVPNETFQFSVTPPHNLRVWFCTQYQVVYAGPVVRSRGDFQPNIYTGGNRPTIVVNKDSQRGTTYLTARPLANDVSFIDTEVNGPASNAPSNNSIYIGTCGGDGNNHNCEAWGRRMFAPMMQANDLALGVSVGMGSDTPAVGGFTNAVANGWETWIHKGSSTITGASTDTLPQNFPPNRVFTFQTVPAISNYTVTATANATISGAPTAAAQAANSAISFLNAGTYVAPNWLRRQ